MEKILPSLKIYRPCFLFRQDCHEVCLTPFIYSRTNKARKKKSHQWLTPRGCGCGMGNWLARSMMKVPRVIVMLYIKISQKWYYWQRTVTALYSPDVSTNHPNSIQLGQPKISIQTIKCSMGGKITPNWVREWVSTTKLLDSSDLHSCMHLSKLRHHTPKICVLHCIFGSKENKL